MKDEQIHGILAGDRPPVPSAGFQGSVMIAIRREAGEVPPIPFPWRRAVYAMGIGLAVVAAGLVAGAYVAGPLPWTQLFEEIARGLLSHDVIAAFAAVLASAATARAGCILAGCER